MAVKRLEHVGVVVDDLPAAIAFFVELGLELEGETSVSGEWVDRIIGLEGAESDIAMLRTPDGQGGLELSRFRSPVHASVEAGGPGAPPSHAPGLRHVLFVVTDVEDTVSRLRGHGAELVGEIVRYGDSYILAYVRGPAGVIVELAEELS